MKTLSLAVIVALAAGIAEADFIPRESQVGRVCDRRVAAEGYSGQNEFSLKRAEELAREFYSAYSGRCSILRLSYGFGKDLLNSTDKPYGEHNSLYPSYVWRRLYVEERPTSPVVRMIALDGAAILQISQKEGIEERLLVGRTDPTRLSFGKSRFRLLHFVAEEYPNYKRTAAYFYLRSPDVLNDEDGVVLSKRLLELAGTDEIHVSVKNDSWFQLASNFPAIYRFEKNELSYPWGPTPFWVRLLPTFLLRPGPSVLRKGYIMTCSANRTGRASCRTALVGQ